MEKFQNFLRGFGNFMVGMPSKEEVDEIRKNNPQMDIFKTDTQLNKEGKVRNEQGNVIDSTTGVITESGNKQGTFSFQDYLNDVGKKVKTDLGNVFKGEKETPEKEERDFLEENKQLLQEISNLSEKARDKAALRTGISNLALSPLIGGQAAMDAAAEINRMTIANMGAMAAQNRVLESNPTKQKIAGKYFR
tara:strand:- start:3 stop:578 length:576 start_codon:yes stop_codon:yes gene_type:complete